jgi:hypothetical protein
MILGRAYSYNVSVGGLDEVGVSPRHFVVPAHAVGDAHGFELPGTD